MNAQSIDKCLTQTVLQCCATTQCISHSTLWSSQKWTKQKIHIFKLDLQHLTDSSLCVRPVYFRLLCITCESKLMNTALCISVSMLIVRNNIKDVWFLCLGILHYNKFRNITKEHSLFKSCKVEAGKRFNCNIPNPEYMIHLHATPSDKIWILIEICRWCIGL